MDIVFVSPEVVPFSKVGGLADVAGSLPKALRGLGHKVTVVSLLYGSVDTHANALARRLVKVTVPLGDKNVAAEVYEARLPSGVSVVLLNAPGLTDRANVYGEADDHLRFAFLCRGAVEWVRAQPKAPDVVHAHDWAAGLVPLYLKLGAESDPKLAGVRSVFTVHNVAHQGLFAADTLRDLGIPTKYFSPEALEFYGKVSWLKAGLLFADRVTTVSPTYLKEIASPASGGGLEGVVQSRGKEMTGILNGVDYAVWNPATDPHLVARYDAEDPSAKERCKTDLATVAGIAPRPDAPLFGYVGRFDTQKGTDLLVEAAPKLMRQDLSLVILGTGDAGMSAALTELAKRFPERVHVRDGFDEALAHKIYAGSDFFLSPSRLEPCGLAHLYAMRYGSIPVARFTGGVRDTVVDCDPQLETGTGFLFDAPDPEEFYGAVSRAVGAFKDRGALGRVRKRAMRRDVSWDRSARQYLTLFQQLSSLPDARAERA